MTINEAIAALQDLKEQLPDYGNNIDVYFDCPHCQVAFMPDFVTTAGVRPAVVLTGKAKKR